MASFQKRGKTWQYTISRMVDGKPDPIRKGGYRTKGEAKQAAHDKEEELKKEKEKEKLVQSGVKPPPEPIPIEKYFADWVDVYKKSVGKNTKARYMDTYASLEEYYKGLTPIQSVDKRVHQEFLNKFAEKHAKESTRKLNSHIRACVRDAIDEGLIKTDFTRGAVISGNNPSKRPEEKHLSFFESKRLLQETLKLIVDGSSYLSHYLILLGLTSGMRFAEMVGLTRSDFDFKKNTISITKSWGYTNKMHEGHGPTKNPQSVRKIKMEVKIMMAFKSYFDRAPENLYKLVFYSADSKYKVVSNGAANKTLNSILDRLNIEPISVHGLRHTHASVLLYKKVSIYYVSERLGHADIETTNQHYAHIVKELREEDEKRTSRIIRAMVG